MDTAVITLIDHGDGFGVDHAAWPKGAGGVAEGGHVASQVVLVAVRNGLAVASVRCLGGPAHVVVRVGCYISLLVRLRRQLTGCVVYVILAQTQRVGLAYQQSPVIISIYRFLLQCNALLYICQVIHRVVLEG